MIIVDSSSQAWDFEVNSSAILTSTAVGGGGPTSVLINDLIIGATTYSLTVSTSGILSQTLTTYSSNPTNIIVHDPVGNPYSIQVNNGILQTTPSYSANVRDLQVFREAIIPVSALRRNQFIVSFVST